MKKFLKLVIILFVITTAFTAIFAGVMMSDVEQAKYTVVAKYNDFEIRDYAPQIVAEADAEGERKTAMNEGFREIADYIFGDNIAKREVDMTAPVTQAREGDSWKVRFMMPTEYKLEALPKPQNPNVKLLEVPSKRFAVVTFSGAGDDAKLAEETARLNGFVKEQKLQAQSAETYAFFNPPWTLPIFRRNEVMLEIAK